MLNRIMVHMIKPSVAPTLILLLVAACSKAAPQPALVGTADVIYAGGDIVTMSDRMPTAEAVAIKGGKIIAVGSRAEVEKERGDATRMVDLAGRALLPGFIDPHSHYFSSLSVANQVNVFAPPAGPGTDVPSIVEALRKFRDERKIAAGEIIQAYGYDENAMPNAVGLSRRDLDKDFPDNPVLVNHVSMHGAVLNSAAFKRFGFSAAMKTPTGGIILREKGSNEPAGLIMEMAYLPVFAALPKPTRDQEVEWSRAGQMIYAAAGITTAQEGATHLADLELMQRVAARGTHVIDLIAYPFVTDFEAVLAKNPVDTWGKYTNGLKLGGGKITLDGSIQGKTAYFSKPYLTGGPSGEKGWAGEPGFPVEAGRAFVKRMYDLGLPLNIHANGDAAIDLALTFHEAAAADDLTRDRHVTVIHAQMPTLDQLKKFVTYKFTPSFFTAHAYYFADTHILNRGREQTFFLSPMRTAIDMGLHPTNHTDFVVTPIDQLFLMWTAVNRVSRSGVVIGPDQRITALEALRAITVYSARQYMETDAKGSLEKGKLADLVILDKNPLTVDSMAIKDIKVLETIKAGTSIYLRQ